MQAEAEEEALTSEVLGVGEQPGSVMEPGGLKVWMRQEQRLNWTENFGSGCRGQRQFDREGQRFEEREHWHRGEGLLQVEHSIDPGTAGWGVNWQSGQDSVCGMKKV